MKNPRAKFNEKLLRQVMEFVADRPEMVEWRCSEHSQDRFSGPGCFEFWVCFLGDVSFPLIPTGHIATRAAKLLGIEYGKEAVYDEFARLFHPPEWDEPFRSEFAATKDKPSQAAIFVRNCESFIESKTAVSV